MHQYGTKFKKHETGDLGAGYNKIIIAAGAFRSSFYQSDTLISAENVNVSISRRYKFEIISQPRIYEIKLTLKI